MDDGWDGLTHAEREEVLICDRGIWMLMEVLRRAGVSNIIMADRFIADGADIGFIEHGPERAGRAIHAVATDVENLAGREDLPGPTVRRI